ncbi:MAG: DUF4129 domain-containing protein, partial [Actinobacteria bacterium]|nr:DUF4129 domain-containing protein [Actinomycetota bacterium]
MTEGPKNKRTLLLISAGMMEITWLYVLACIIFLMLKAPIFPIWTAILAFFTPILIHSVLKGRGRRIIIHVILHAFFYLTILLYTFYFYGNWQGPFFNFKWLEMILHQQYGSVGGLAYLFILFWCSFLWISGYKLANRSHDFYQIASRFDLGIVALVSAFIILGSMNLSFPHSEVSIIYYFLFSMFAISLAKNLGSSKTKYSHQFTGTSLILTFILAVLLIGSWVVLFFLPQLSQAAQAGYHVLKIVSKPLGNLLLKIILFLFSGYGNRAVNVSSTSSGDSSITMIESSEPSWWAHLLEWVITWGGIILLSLLALIASGWLLWSLWKWFSTKTEVDTKRKGFFEELLLWFLHLFSQAKKVLYKMLGLLKNIRRKQETISVLFQKLCRWGHSSGLPRESSKTPLEYGRYLTHFFPDSQPDIQLIIQIFNQEIYGKKSIQAEQWRKAKKAWQHLSSPTKWPLRLWVKIFYSRKFR